MTSEGAGKGDIKMFRIAAFLMFISGPAVGHEVLDWQIENTRGDTLKTEISIQSFAGDWCGEEPATLSLICEDGRPSMVFHSNCTPSITANGKTFVGFYFDVDLYDSKENMLDASEDMKTLVLSDVTWDKIFAFNRSDTVRVSLTGWGSWNKDISFDLSNFDEAVTSSGIQCGIQQMLP